MTEPPPGRRADGGRRRPGPLVIGVVMLVGAALMLTGLMLLKSGMGG